MLVKSPYSPIFDGFHPYILTHVFPLSTITNHIITMYQPYYIDHSLTIYGNLHLVISCQNRYPWWSTNLIKPLSDPPYLMVFIPTFDSFHPYKIKFSIFMSSIYPISHYPSKYPMISHYIYICMVYDIYIYPLKYHPIPSCFRWNSGLLHLPPELRFEASPERWGAPPQESQREKMLLEEAANIGSQYVFGRKGE